MSNTGTPSCPHPWLCKSSIAALKALCLFLVVTCGSHLGCARPVSIKREHVTAFDHRNVFSRARLERKCW